MRWRLLSTFNCLIGNLIVYDDDIGASAGFTLFVMSRYLTTSLI
jgi:hypothetical protein